MTATIASNPYLTSNAAGSFQVQSEGLVQGTFYDDPAVRYALAGGVLSDDETIPMWGGVGISELVPTGSVTTPSTTLGTIVSRALLLTTAEDPTSANPRGTAGEMTGWSVFNQANAMVNSPQSPVPLAGSANQVNLFRFGSGARLALAIDPALVSLEGELITTQLSWDFNAQRLIKGIPSYAGEAAASATYNSTTGILAITFSTAPFGASVGDTMDGVYVTVDTFNQAVLNGDWPIVTTTTSGTIVELQLPTGLGSISPTGGALVAGGGILPVRVLDLNVTNSMTVDYDATTGFATWNRNGACAVVLI